jgi:hypothetical protein
MNLYNEINKPCITQSHLFVSIITENLPIHKQRYIDQKHSFERKYTSTSGCDHANICIIILMWIISIQEKNSSNFCSSHCFCQINVYFQIGQPCEY